MSLIKASLYGSLLLFIAALVDSCQPQQVQAQTEEESPDEEYPLLQSMGYNQRFAQKLWFAGQAGNWELADFYTHELEEVTEELIEHNVIDEGYNLSELTAAVLVPAVENVEEAVKAKDSAAFVTQYKALVNSCNACHAATNHAYLRIIVPQTNVFPNQDFTVSAP